MSDKVSLMLKVDESVKALVMECAKMDRRTMSAYVEVLIEKDARARNILKDESITEEQSNV